MCLVKVDIEDGPTKKALYEAFDQNKKVYFKIEDEYYPHRIMDMTLLKNNKGAKLIGVTLTGRFIATYYFENKQGTLITKYGRIRDDV